MQEEEEHNIRNQPAIRCRNSSMEIKSAGAGAGAISHIKYMLK